MEKHLEISLNNQELNNKNSKKEKDLLLTPSINKTSNFHVSPR